MIFEFAIETSSNGFDEYVEFEAATVDQLTEQFKERFGELFRRGTACGIVYVDEGWSVEPHLISINKAVDIVRENIDELFS